MTKSLGKAAAKSNILQSLKFLSPESLLSCRQATQQVSSSSRLSGTSFAVDLCYF